MNKKFKEPLVRCKHWSTYQGLRKPTCGCLTCHKIWTDKELQRTIKEIFNKLDE